MTALKLQYNTIFSSIIGFILLLLCVFPRVTPIGIALLVITIVTGYLKKKLNFSFNKLTFLLVALYLCYVLGLFFSENISDGLKGLEYKVSLFLLPLITMVRFKNSFQLQNVFIGLIVGCLLGSFIGIFDAISCYQLNRDLHCFLSSNVSTVIHPTYFSSYIIMAIVALWIGYNRNYRFFSLFICWLLTIYFILYLLMMMSLAGMLFLAILLVGVVLVYCFKKWKWKGLLLVISLSPIFFYSSYKMIPQVRSEIDDLTYYGERYLSNSDHYFEELYYPYSGTETRLIMWRLSVEQIRDTPFGVGSGDADQVLAERMAEKNLNQEFIDRHLNPHNQFFQTWVEVGFIGVLLLVLFIVLVVYKSFKNRDYFLLILTFNFAMNCLFESMLQRQSGIVFYTVLFCLLLVPSTLKNENERA